MTSTQSTTASSFRMDVFVRQNSTVVAALVISFSVLVAGIAGFGRKKGGRYLTFLSVPAQIGPEWGKTSIVCLVCWGYHASMNENSLLNNLSPYQQGVFLIINKQMIPLSKPVTTLGRQIENDIVFQEEFLSRFHAEIILEHDRYVLVDKNSTSGTFVNGRRIDRCVLNSGDLIALANIYIMFVNNNPKIVGKSLGTTQSLRQTGILVPRESK
ncbi:MAG TPA: FHA domain-containing protein [Anaerolineales bacterium]|nr:FHA domain-containing protein [Anaerolineales bacterium]